MPASVDMSTVSRYARQLLAAETECRKQLADVQAHRCKRFKSATEKQVNIEEFMVHCLPSEPDTCSQDFSFVSLTPKTPCFEERQNSSVCFPIQQQPAVELPTQPIQQPAVEPTPVAFRGQVTNYRQLKVLGSGTFGKVFLAQHKDTHALYAIKTFCKPTGGDKARRHKLARFFLRYAKRELSTLETVQKLNHPNIVGLQEVIRGRKSSSCFVVMDYHPHDLAMVLRRRQKARCQTSSLLFSPNEARSLLRQLLSGVAALHQHGVIHRDLKPANLLMGKSECDLKICDFGQSVVVAVADATVSISPLTTSDSTSPSSSPSLSPTVSVKEREPAVCTLPYRCPERLVGSDESTTSNDMWAIGCIFAEILMGKPFLSAGRGANEAQQLALIVQILGPPPTSFFNFLQATTPKTNKLIMIRNRRLALLRRVSLENKHNHDSLRTKLLPTLTQTCLSDSDQGLELADSALALLKALLSWDPSKRITAAEALRHPWLCDYAAA